LWQVPALPTERLAEKPYVAVILRLLLNRGRLERGELVDLNGNSHGHFTNFRELTTAIRAWIAARAPGEEQP
jgi:hypothetical protein